MISPEIDLRAAQLAFVRDGRCRVDTFLAPEGAERLCAPPFSETEFDVAYPAHNWCQLSHGGRWMVAAADHSRIS